MRPLLAASIAAVSVLSATVPSAHAKKQAINVAYVDMARALNEVNDGKSAKQQLKSEFEQRQTKLDRMQKELKAEKKRFDKKKAMMKPDARAAKQQELQRRFMELQQTYMKLQQELVKQESELTQGIAAKIRKVIAKIGDRDGYDLIVDIGDTVLYYKRHREITDQVIREYNRRYGKN